MSARPGVIGSGAGLGHSCFLAVYAATAISSNPLLGRRISGDPSCEPRRFKACREGTGGCVVSRGNADADRAWLIETRIKKPASARP